MIQYYIARGSGKLGRFPLEEVVAKLHSGEFRTDDLAFKEGFSDWKKISEIPELVDELSSLQVAQREREISLMAEESEQFPEAVKKAIEKLELEHAQQLKSLEERYLEVKSKLSQVIKEVDHLRRKSEDHDELRYRLEETSTELKKASTERKELEQLRRKVEKYDSLREDHDRLRHRLTRAEAKINELQDLKDHQAQRSLQTEPPPPPKVDLVPLPPIPSEVPMPGAAPEPAVSAVNADLNEEIKHRAGDDLGGASNEEGVFEEEEESLQKLSITELSLSEQQKKLAQQDESLMEAPCKEACPQEEQAEPVVAEEALPYSAEEPQEEHVEPVVAEVEAVDIPVPEPPLPSIAPAAPAPVAPGDPYPVVGSVACEVEPEPVNPPKKKGFFARIFGKDREDAPVTDGEVEPSAPSLPAAPVPVSRCAPAAAPAPAAPVADETTSPSHASYTTPISGSPLHSAPGYGHRHPSPTQKDHVNFSAMAQGQLEAGSRFILDIWAHTQSQTKQVEARANEMGRGGLKGTKQGVPVEQGRVLDVRLDLPGFDVADPVGVLVWNGEPVNASFPVTVPKDCTKGPHLGVATMSSGRVMICKIDFQIEIGVGARAASEDLTVKAVYPEKAFASYSSQNRDEVMLCLQMAQKWAPKMKVDIDVISLRSGQDYREVLERLIPAQDVFYLFWSKPASQSEEVEWEWRLALRKKGLGFIDIIPLEDPRQVPPPEELSSLHFNDKWLAFKGRS